MLIIATWPRIDLGMDRPVSAADMAETCTKLLGQPIKVEVLPIGLIFGVMGIFSERMRDMGAMIRYFGRGTYIADTTVQAKLFGPAPAFEDSLRRALKDRGLLPA